MPYTENIMKIGIIGAGGIAQAVAKQALGAGYEVMLSNSRGPETLNAVVQRLGAGAAAGSVREAAQAACAKRRRRISSCSQCNGRALPRHSRRFRTGIAAF